jgi:hypothetical protein
VRNSTLKGKLQIALKERKRKKRRLKQSAVRLNTIRKLRRVVQEVMICTG